MEGTATFDLLRKRLSAAAQGLRDKSVALNHDRAEVFGRIDSKLLARFAARTEHNCVARDIVRVGELLVFGFNVFIGLKKETLVDDVFCLYQLHGDGAEAELQAVPSAGTFLADLRFVADFRELFTYYKETTLDQLRVVGERLLLIFRTGSQVGDKRVFRFAIARDGSLSYLDNRGERDHVVPPSHGFEWTAVTRDQHVIGRHPHANILDTLFVETIGGDLTVKIENNTETGLGIYAEPVEDKNQALADADLAYADLSTLIILRIKPYRETAFRYLVFNKRLKTVERIDEVGLSCVELPEDHGIIFPGGYYLSSGEFIHFRDLGHDFNGYRLKRVIKPSSGEDVLYVFYEPVGGRYALLAYNLIDRRVGQPLLAEGYARFDDGRVLLFTPEAGDATRQHIMQLWRTPFASDEFLGALPKVKGLLGRLGNAAVVRALADLTELARLAENAGDFAGFERLLQLTQRVQSSFPWLHETEAKDIAGDLDLLSRSGKAALEAYAQLDQAKVGAGRVLAKAGGEVRESLSKIAGFLWRQPSDFITAIAELKRQRGALAGLREQSFMDVAAVDALDQTLRDDLHRIGERALKFFSEPAAMDALRAGLQDIAKAVQAATGTRALDAVGTKLDELAESLDGLSGLISSFDDADPQARADLLKHTSTLYAQANRVRSQLRLQRETLAEQELGVEFAAQLTVQEQALTHALDRCDTPEAADEGLAKLLGQLEALEARFGVQPSFLIEIGQRREALLEAFTAKREQITSARSARADALKATVSRVLEGIPRRVQALVELADVNAFFASDVLIERATAQIAQLRALQANVLADELSSKLRALKESAVRDLRDRQDLGTTGAVLKLGPHRFTIERQRLELALLHQPDGLHFSLVGTDYRRPVHDADSEAFRPVWGQRLPNETADVYRGEVLAYRLLQKLEHGDVALRAALLDSTPEALEKLVSAAAIAAPSEDYQRGVHDADATRILQAVATLSAQAGELRLPVRQRLLAQLLVGSLRDVEQDHLRLHVQGLHWVLEQGGSIAAPARWRDNLIALAPIVQIEADAATIDAVARHIVRSMGEGSSGFAAQAAALDLADQVRTALSSNAAAALRNDLALDERVALASELVRVKALDSAAQIQLEAAVILALPQLPRDRKNVALQVRVTELRGEHPLIAGTTLDLDLPEFLARLAAHEKSVAPQWHAFAALRQRLLQRESARLSLERFTAKPMAGFVRNKLIDAVYLPLIANNLSKQIGTVGEQRSDRSGMLLLISPPGYGKTTLMEYLADRLGMVFVRVNGPTLGHVTELDPAAAGNEAAAEELRKLNLGLAMGSNVMLYVDDIQHCSPTFLQKFIALADGTRRIDAVVDGVPQTLDLRGKRFALVMAGNPYTESGDAFQIPDMLANRADVYNLGDVLGGREALFADSYIENALTAHPGTAALTDAPRDTIAAALRIAKGEGGDVPLDLPGGNETLELLRRMVAVRDVLMQVNAGYVGSAAQDDAFRTEPPFKLQGSYRNMAKLSAQLSPLMTDAEVAGLLRDHYRGEAQTLGARAEENLLKLALMTGQATPAEQARWQQIVHDFQRLMKQGGKDADGATRAAQVLAEIAQVLQGQNDHGNALINKLHTLDHLATISAQLSAPQTLHAPAVLHDTLAQLAKSYDETLLPLVSALHHKMTLDHDIWEQLRATRSDVQALLKAAKKKS